MKTLRKLTDALLYSNSFIGVCAVALVFTNQLTVSGEIHLDQNCWFVFFSTIFTYSFLKFRMAGNSGYSTSHHTWAEENPQLSRNILLISILGTGGFFISLESDVKLIVAVLAAITAFYGFVAIPFTKPKRKLREFGSLKTVFVAIVWSVTTVVIPLNSSNLSNDMLVFLLVRRFLFILALTMMFEIKDMKDDEEHNLRTLPLRYGVPSTKLLAQGILFALILINAVQYFFFDISLYNMLAVNLSLVISTICIQVIKEETPEIWYYSVLDGMMILQFVFVYIAAKFIQ